MAIVKSEPWVQDGKSRDYAEALNKRTRKRAEAEAILHGFTCDYAIHVDGAGRPTPMTPDNSRRMLMQRIIEALEAKEAAHVD